MDLIPVLYEAEERYGYMSDEAIAIFQKVLKRAEERNGKSDPYVEVRTKFVDRITGQEKRDIMDMYALGYSSREVARYVGKSHQNIDNFWRKMRNEGKMPTISLFERRALHDDLLKTMYRGKFNDVELNRMGRGDAKR